MASNRLQWPQVKLTVLSGGALLLTTAPATFPTGEADFAEWRCPLPLEHARPEQARVLLYGVCVWLGI